MIVLEQINDSSSPAEKCWWNVPKCKSRTWSGFQSRHAMLNPAGDPATEYKPWVTNLPHLHLPPPRRFCSFVDLKSLSARRYLEENPYWSAGLLGCPWHVEAAARGHLSPACKRGLCSQGVHQGQVCTTGLLSPACPPQSRGSNSSFSSICEVLQV